MSLIKKLGSRIDYHPFKNAVNRYLAKPSWGDARPVYWDIDATYPELRQLEQGYPRIRAEVEALLETQDDMPTYHEINAPSTEIAATTRGRWNVFMLELLGYRAERNLARCPETARLLQGIPRRLQAMFSVLDPGKSVPQHNGPYYGYLRYHLGIHVPGENPPQIRVAGQPYVWKEGEGVLFDDSWPHEVENHSSEPRVVLIVDMPRPLPRIPDWVNRGILYGAAGPLYGRKVIQRVEREAA
jgi:aspartate beta-hydroxylase/beta-hydroxylase